MQHKNLADLLQNSKEYEESNLGEDKMEKIVKSNHKKINMFIALLRYYSHNIICTSIHLIAPLLFLKVEKHFNCNW